MQEQQHSFNSFVFEREYNDIDNLRHARPNVRRWYKQFQLVIFLGFAILPNTPRGEAEEFARCNRILSRYRFIPYILGNREHRTVTIYGRWWILRKRPAKDRFTYDPTLRSWHFAAKP